MVCRRMHTFCCCSKVLSRVPPASIEAEGARLCRAARLRAQPWPLGGLSLLGSSRSCWAAAGPLAPGGCSGCRGRAGSLKAESRCFTMAIMALRASMSIITRQSCTVTSNGLPITTDLNIPERSHWPYLGVTLPTNNIAVVLLGQYNLRAFRSHIDDLSGENSSVSPC